MGRPPDSPLAFSGTTLFLADFLIHKLSLPNSLLPQVLVCWGFPGGASGKESALSMQEMQDTWGQSLSRDRSPGVGNGNQLQDSYLENSTDSAGGDTIEQHMHAWFFGYFLRLQVDKRCPSM